jgi:phthalate 4,5-dioxygenase
MLSVAENETLTRVGRGAPMGELMRQYWIPACMSTELTVNGPPIRLMLLGEKLVGFRDSSGRVGIFDHRCPHRCASLFFGRNEGNGIRCVYHGWKFDVDGRCLDMPNVWPARQFVDRVSATAYKVIERNGLIWVYLGPRAEPPPMPLLGPLCVPESDVRILMMQRECNWLQALEGDIDTSHFGFLHGGAVDPAEVDPDAPSRFAYLNRAPEYHVEDTPWGTMYAAYRDADPGEVYYRLAHFAFPFWTLIPDGPLRTYILGEAWVPMDDTHTMMVQVAWNRTRRSARTLKDGKPVPGLSGNWNFLPNSTDWYGRWRHVANRTNDYMIDRDAQRSLSYSGIEGVALQDQAITESMGEIVDRSLEHLAPSDRMISRTRQRMLAAARALASDGTPPPGLDDPELCRTARSGDFVAPKGLTWLDAYAEELRHAETPEPVL